jgi:hypothetical protein
MNISVHFNRCPEDVDVLSLLLDKGADIDAADKVRRGRTNTHHNNLAFCSVDAHIGYETHVFVFFIRIR